MTGENIDNKYSISSAPIASPIIMGSIKPGGVDNSGEKKITIELRDELTIAVDAESTSMVRNDRPVMSAVNSDRKAELNRISESTPHAITPLSITIMTVARLTASTEGIVNAAPSINPNAPGIPKSKTATGRKAAGRKMRLTRGAISAASKK